MKAFPAGPSRIGAASTGLGGIFQPSSGSVHSSKLLGGAVTTTWVMTTCPFPVAAFPARCDQAMWVQLRVPVASTEEVMVGNASVRNRQSPCPCSKGRKVVTRRGWVNFPPLLNERTAKMASSVCCGLAPAIPNRRQDT